MIFRDWSGHYSNFFPCALVEHMGNQLEDGETSGHYVCDIEDEETGQWFRTNDNSLPIKINKESATKKPVVIMFKREK